MLHSFLAHLFNIECEYIFVFIIKVILDITFYEENKLVDQEFPEDCSPFKIQQLLQDLTEPEVLAGRLAPAQEVCICVSQNYFV